MRGGSSSGGYQSLANMVAKGGRGNNNSNNRDGGRGGFGHGQKGDGGGGRAPGGVSSGIIC
jgi:hypothetical protein